MAQELQKPISPHDCNGQRRRMCLADLCYYTLLGHENIQTAIDLSKLLNVGIKQAQIVWDILIKHGVLRKGPQGYSARQWMIERGILGDISRRRRQDSQPQGPSGQQTQQPSQTGYRTDGGKTSW
ncbi:MAG: hypothetical protein IJ268_13055 [Proteobacteria bacterium]|nr:hypothetical protein [Pseudomonadota bacterium]